MASTIVRGLWFVFIGWWLGPLWFIGSLALMGSIIFFPFGAYTVTKTWSVMTLSKNPQTVVIEARSQRDN
jgi:uncharacterized membrane protein YccF (DUF307 family)